MFCFRFNTEHITKQIVHIIYLLASVHNGTVLPAELIDAPDMYSSAVGYLHSNSQSTGKKYSLQPLQHIRQLMSTDQGAINWQ
jgi:hypothetical protein